MWAIAWDVFHHMPSQGGRGRRAAVDFVVCFGWGGFFFFCSFFFASHAHGVLQVRGHLASCSSLLVSGTTEYNFYKVSAPDGASLQ